MGMTSGKSSAINMTPLIDVVLVLLVIVLITAQVAQRAQRSMAAQLPKAANGQDLASPHVVSLLPSGQMFFDKQPVTLEALPAALQASGAKNGRVLLDVDGNVAHARVVEILDALANAGVNDAAFATEKKK